MERSFKSWKSESGRSEIWKEMHGVRTQIDIITPTSMKESRWKIPRSKTKPVAEKNILTQELHRNQRISRLQKYCICGGSESVLCLSGNISDTQRNKLNPNPEATLMEETEEYWPSMKYKLASILHTIWPLWEPLTPRLL